MNKIRVFEAFSGIGAQAMALKRLQSKYPDMLDFEFVGTSEIEPSAIKAYNAVHGDTPCYGDISKIDWDEVPDFDLFTMSSPCQDFSVAGRQAGGDEGSGTRSSLLWECRKAIIAKKPKYILFENVSAVVSKKFIRGFNKWQAELESYGYTNFAKVLNSKDYGICQNRERLFMISIRDCTQSYHFPEPFKLENRIKDILEPYGTVDESFYFTAEQLAGMLKYCKRKSDEGCGFQTNFRTDDDIATCDTSRYGAEYTNTYLREPSLHQRLSLYADNAQAGRVYDVDGIAPCLDTCSVGNRMPKILTPVRTEEAKELRRKGIEVFKHRELVPREDGVSNTITTFPHDNCLIEPCILGYTRDDNGKVCDRHDKNIANTVHTSTGNGGNTDQFVKEPVAVAMRGRNPDNPSDRSKGCPTEQRLEFGDSIANCITTVQKDSMVAEPMVGNDPRRIFGKDDFQSDVCPALMAVDYKAPKLVKEPIELSFANLPDKTVLKDEDGKGYLWQDGSLWRIRKLTGKEVFRLMDVSDEDIEKIQSYPFKSYAEREKAISEATAKDDKKELNRIKRESISKSAQYSLAGNSIVCQCLICIFENLFVPLQSRYNKSNHPIQLSLF